jgi:hypothetical protein
MHHTTRNFLIPISAGTILSVLAFLAILWSVDPYTTSWLSHLFFYLTLALSLTGLFSLGGTMLRKKFAPGMFTEQLRTSLRQAGLLVLLIISLLLLQSFNLLFWWVGITLILFIITLEIFLTS